MVWLNVKKDKKEQFFCELPAVTPITDVVLVCVELRNLYYRLLRLATSVKLDLEKRSSSVAAEQNALLAIREAKELLSEERVAARVCITQEELRKAIGNVAAGLAGSTTAVSWSSQLLAHAFATTDFDALQDGDLDPSTVEIWFAGRILQRGKLLNDYVGTNEKTRIVVKLQEAGDIKPSREPVLDEAAQKAMTAWHFKKQQEQRLLEADEAEFTTSAWANSGALKHSLNGIESIKIL